MRPSALQALVQWVESRRTARRVAGVLAFACGAINAGGLLAVQRQMSILNAQAPVPEISQGLISSPSTWVFAAAVLLVSFMAGAVITGALIARARHLRLHWDLAHPLLLEAVLFLLFGVLGSNGESLGEWFAPSAAVLLCFGLGLQNAVIGSISRTEIDATHMAGILTGLGMELGRWTHGGPAHKGDTEGTHEVNFARLMLYATILGLFLAGCVLGIIVFAVLDYVATIPLAAALLALVAPSMLLDFWAADKNSKGKVP